jgi:hypothetical protein
MQSRISLLFKDNERIRELRDPFDYFPRNGVQAILNGVAFFSLHNCLERSLTGFLHPFAWRNTREAVLLTHFTDTVARGTRVVL